jgi:phospholipid/cholesterol/gamma-HCH transport system substrate-binding protein
MVGGFVLVALVILIAGALWITGSAAMFGERVPYTVLLRDSAGIEAGDRVRVAGVSIGRVQSVNLRHDESWPVTIDIVVKPDVDLRANARGIITSQGLLGEKFLQIDPGTEDHPSLSSGADIPSRPQMNLDKAMARLDEIGGKLSVLLDEASGMLEGAGGRLDTMLDRTNAMLSDENAENLRATLVALRETMESAGPRLTALTANLEATSVKMDSAFGDLPAIMERIDSLLASVDGALGPDGERLAGVLDAAQSGMTSAEHAMGTITANRAEIDQTLADLRDTLSNLKAFSQTLKERPYSLVRVRNPDDRKPGDGVEP